MHLHIPYTAAMRFRRPEQARVVRNGNKRREKTAREGKGPPCPARPPWVDRRVYSFALFCVRSRSSCEAPTIALRVGCSYGGSFRGKGVRVTRPLRANDRSGKVKLATLIWVVVVGIVAYYGIQIGNVYWRKYKLEETVDRELSFAGQIADGTIRQRLTQDIAGMHLPPAASRFQFARVTGPRALRFTVSYVDTVNLIFTKRPFRVSINTRRTF